MPAELCAEFLLTPLRGECIVNGYLPASERARHDHSDAAVRARWIVVGRRGYYLHPGSGWRFDNFYDPFQPRFPDLFNPALQKPPQVI